MTPRVILALTASCVAPRWSQEARAKKRNKVSKFLKKKGVNLKELSIDADVDLTSGSVSGMAAGMKEAGGELAGGVKGAGSGVAGGVTNAGSAAKRGSVKE